MAFEQAGPTSLRERLKVFLADLVDAGLLKIDDLDLAAEQFFALTMGRMSVDRALGLPPPPREAVEKQVRGAVAMFLSHYGRTAPEAASVERPAPEGAPTGDDPGHSPCPSRRR